MKRKVVLVTGGSGEIGSACVKEFAKRGYNVVINYCHSKKKAQELKNFINDKYRAKSLIIKADIAKEKDVLDMVSTIMKEFGHIDVLINNAAIDESGDFFSKNKTSFEKVLGTNLIGTFLVSKAVAQAMLREKSGKIINISSNNSINKYDPSTVEYDVSKAGIDILTKDMAKELSPFINVNAVAPGWVLTEKNKKLDAQLDGCFVASESKKIFLKRFADPLEIAKVVLFLASDEANYINGEIIVVDGGC